MLHKESLRESHAPGAPAIKVAYPVVGVAPDPHRYQHISGIGMNFSNF